MPKFLVQAKYTSQGIQGLVNDSATGRRADVQSAVKAAGGQVEAFYYAFGEDDVISIVDLPDQITAAAFSLTISGTGAVNVKTTPLLTVEDVDKALDLQMKYRAPGE
ncbi:MAG TPA: GYD domain-containing protein [Bryobacteraceae bacterium]|nr:GYD domain-containing protein [Bryobacteraceae bacterium]